jgi:hypothetical protein
MRAQVDWTNPKKKQKQTINKIRKNSDANKTHYYKMMTINDNKEDLRWKNCCLVTEQLVRKCMSLWCVEEMRNLELWPSAATCWKIAMAYTYATRLCTHVDSGKQALMGLIAWILLSGWDLNQVIWGVCCSKVRNFLNPSLFMCHHWNPCWKSCWEINTGFQANSHLE